MSTFYTAPPIYNTGGWGFRGDIPTFNPSGILDDVSETGKTDVTLSNVYYAGDDTFSHLNTRVDFDIDPKFDLVGETHRFNSTNKLSNLTEAYSLFYRSDSSNKVSNLTLFDSLFKSHSVRTLYKITPRFDLVGETDRFNTSNSLSIITNQSSAFSNTIIKATYKVDPTFNLTGAPERVGGILTLPSINNINAPVETNKTIKSFSSYETTNYVRRGHRHKLKTTLSDVSLASNNLQRLMRLSSSVSQFNYFLEEVISAKDKAFLQSIYYSKIGNQITTLTSNSLSSIQKSKVENSKFEALASISSSFQHKIHGNIRSTRLKTSNELELNIFKESLMKDIKSYVSPDGTLYFLNRKYVSISNSPDGTNYFNNSLFKRLKIYVSPDDTNYLRSSFIKGKTSTLVNLGYNLKEMHEGFSRTTTLPNINTISTPIGKSFGKINVDKLNFYIKPSQKAFFTNTLNQVNYNPVPFYEGQTQSSFPTGLEFPKIRYQTAEPDYTKASTGSNTYGYIQYEGLDAGNLFFYEPDADSYKWAYFEYNIRSGIFNPCEFPETADRTLDPVQISSRSNKGDNPYWYLPDLLTIDSTIHTVDGAPCQYIAQENSRFAEIFLEDDTLLLPENFEQTGQLFEI